MCFGCPAWGHPRRPALRSSLASTVSAAWSRRRCGHHCGRRSGRRDVGAGRWASRRHPAWRRPVGLPASRRRGRRCRRRRPSWVSFLRDHDPRGGGGASSVLSGSSRLPRRPACSDRSSRRRPRRCRFHGRRASVAAGAAAGAAVAAVSARPRRQRSRHAPLRLRRRSCPRGAIRRRDPGRHGFAGAGERRCPAHVSRPRPRVDSTRSSTSSQASVLGHGPSARAARSVALWPRVQAQARARVPARARAPAQAQVLVRARRVAASPQVSWVRPSASPGPCPRWRLASASLRSGGKAGPRVPPVWCLDPSVGSLLSRCARGGCTRGTDRDQRPPMGGTAGSCCMKARAAGEPARRATCCLHSVRSFGLVLAIGRGALIGCLRRSRATSTIDRYSRTGGGSGPAVTSAPRIPAGVAPTVEPEPTISPGVGHLAHIAIPPMNLSSAG